jgi:hypothetical protein
VGEERRVRYEICKESEFRVGFRVQVIVSLETEEMIQEEDVFDSDVFTREVKPTYTFATGAFRNCSFSCL